MSSRLLDQLRDVIRVRNYSIRTEQAYVQWARRFILFNEKRHPKEMHDQEVIDYLTYLAVKRKVAANTQNQALNALVFLYKHVVNKPLGDITSAARAKRPRKLPTVLSRDEVKELLLRLRGTHLVIGALLYGSGLRLMECLRLRVKDIDFSYSCIHIHDGKGAKDRIVTLPSQLHTVLANHLHHTQLMHRADLRKDLGEVYLPFALARKYPNAARDWKWQYVFPSSKTSIDPRSNRHTRHHIYLSTFQKAMRRAVKESNITKQASSHTLRPLLRNPCIGKRHGHTHCAAATGSCLTGDDRNIYACTEKGRSCGSKSARGSLPSLEVCF